MASDLESCAPRNEHRWTIGKETQDNSCAHVYSPGYRYGLTDSLYGAADIGSRYGLVPGPIRVLSARQARAAAVVFTPRSSGQPIGWRCLNFPFFHSPQSPLSSSIKIEITLFNQSRHPGKGKRGTSGHKLQLGIKIFGKSPSAFLAGSQSHRDSRG